MLPYTAATCTSAPQQPYLEQLIAGLHSQVTMEHQGVILEGLHLQIQQTNIASSTVVVQPGHGHSREPGKQH